MNNQHIDFARLTVALQVVQHVLDVAHEAEARLAMLAPQVGEMDLAGLQASMSQSSQLMSVALADVRATVRPEVDRIFGR